MTQILLLAPSYCRGNWSTERASHLPKTRQNSLANNWQSGYKFAQSGFTAWALNLHNFATYMAGI